MNKEKLHSLSLSSAFPSEIKLKDITFFREGGKFFSREFVEGEDN